MTIAVENLTFGYGRGDVLRDVTVQAGVGRIVAVIGPNAAGKTTLLRCIIGALKPQHGRVVMDGADVHRLSARKLASMIAYVPQRSIVSAAFTVRQVIELGRYALTPNRARVEAAIERLDLSDIARQPYPQLSAGQQQRVTLARAMAQLERGGHMILDEPTSAMDLRHAQQCMQLLRELASNGAAVVMAMHDLPMAAVAADDVWLMDGGRLACAGAAADVMTEQRLGQIFGVEFAWTDGPWGARVLAVRTPNERTTATID